MRVVVLESELSNVRALAKEGKRVDGRKMDEIRPMEIEKDISENAEGSVRVKLGDTEVIAGLKLLLGVPYPDSQDEGSISVGGEMLPLSHGEFEVGRPTSEEIEVSRVVDRGIRESKSIDFKELCIEEGKKVWVGFVDFYSINFDGNLFDSGSIAAVASFLLNKKPKLDKDGNIVKGEYSGKVKLKNIPVMNTFVKVGGKIMIDPNYAEEKAAEARFSVSTIDDKTMVAMQKGVGGSFTLEEVNEMMDISFKKAKETRKVLSKL